MTSTPPPPRPATPPPAGPAHHAQPKKSGTPSWVWIVGAAALALVIGIGIGAASGSASTKEDIKQAESSQGSTAAELDETEQQLNDRAAELDQRQADLEAREAAVTATEQQIEANTIPGEGTFLVGSDIQPGTYRSVDNSGCYWQRSSDTSGSFEGIIANGNVEGQAVVTIDSSDVAFTTNRCNDWTKVG